MPPAIDRTDGRIEMAEFMLMFVMGPGEQPPKEGHGSALVGRRLSDVYTDPGRVVTNRSGRFVATEGPLAETKEVVGGYSVIEAADYDEAVELCRDHPSADHGSIVIRQLA
jgi:hypothetical protein